MRSINFLLHLMDPANEGFRTEARMFYELSKDAGERPYKYFFPDLECVHSQNAIDTLMRNLYIHHENESQNKPKKPVDDPTPQRSPVVIVGATP